MSFFHIYLFIFFAVDRKRFLQFQEKYSQKITQHKLFTSGTYNREINWRQDCGTNLDICNQ